MKKLKIAVLTTFYKWSKAYSLTSVVENQLLTLVKHGYPTVLFVHDNFKSDDKVPKGVEIRKVIPRFKLVDYSNNSSLQKGFWEQSETVYKALEEHLKDIDVVLTHDWIFQGWFLPYNIGMRKAQPKLKCRWFHWIHSAPSPRPANLKHPFDSRFTTMPNSKLIYMNYYDTLRLAEMYGGVLDDVRIVFNPLDHRSFYQLHPLTEKLIDKYRLLDADVIDVYPLSSTRFDGKKPDKVIQILGEIKKQGKSVRFICCNAHANADREKKAIEELIHYAIERGLTREEVIFTSFEGEEYELGVPHRVVRELFSLANLFIFPTISENCPLILLEAAMSKCLLVLNESFPPLRDFFGKDALYFKFGSLIENVNYDDEELFFHDVALIIIGELNKNRPLNAFTTLKQKFNFDWVFKNQLEPLFYEQYDR
jgi:hypothetical protein